MHRSIRNAEARVEVVPLHSTAAKCTGPIRPEHVSLDRPGAPAYGHRGVRLPQVVRQSAVALHGRASTREQQRSLTRSPHRLQGRDTKQPCRDDDQRCLSQLQPCTGLPAAATTKDARRTLAGFAALQRKAKEKEQRAYLDNLGGDHPVAVAMRKVLNMTAQNNCRRILNGKREALDVAEYSRRVPAALKMSAADASSLIWWSRRVEAAGANVFAINMESVAGGCEERTWMLRWLSKRP